MLIHTFRSESGIWTSTGIGKCKRGGGWQGILRHHEFSTSKTKWSPSTNILILSGPITVVVPNCVPQNPNTINNEEEQIVFFRNNRGMILYDAFCEEIKGKNMISNNKYPSKRREAFILGRFRQMCTTTFKRENFKNIVFEF